MVPGSVQNSAGIHAGLNACSAVLCARCVLEADFIRRYVTLDIDCFVAFVPKLCPHCAVVNTVVDSKDVLLPAQINGLRS